MEARLDQVWAAAHATHAPPDPAPEGIDIRWAESLEGMALEIGPDSLIGVEFRGIGRQEEDGDPLRIGQESGTDKTRAVYVDPVPDKEHPARDVAKQMPGKARDVSALDRTSD